MNKNLLLMTDAYKLAHLQQYPKGTNKIYSYLIARSGKTIPETVFFGLQYYLKEYLSIPVSHSDVDEAIQYRKMILGDCPPDIEKAWRGLANLGYLPVEIKAVEEGTVMPVKNVLMTITNTHPDFFWLPNMLESFLLKIWNTITVASYSRKLKQLAQEYSDITCDNNGHIPFAIHDFGYRGVSSEETGALSGAAHLLNFLGTDTVPAVKLLNEYYGPVEGPIGLSVPASEHSVMCSFGRENELDAFKNMLKLYPNGIVSIVSDTYDLWNVLTNFSVSLREEILARDGKVVFRPDSGNPELIINGDPESDINSPAYLGALECLGRTFGFTRNEKGYKVLNPKVGLIYGDGMYYERYERTLQEMARQGWASSNLVIGVGGLLLQQRSRDEQGFAFKATYCEVNGEPREIVKDPITDPGKKSHKGLLALHKDFDGEYYTKDQCTHSEEKEGILKSVYKDGVILKTYTLGEIRNRIND